MRSSGNRKKKIPIAAYREKREQVGAAEGARPEEAERNHRRDCSGLDEQKRSRPELRRQDSREPVAASSPGVMDSIKPNTSPVRPKVAAAAPRPVDSPVFAGFGSRARATG